MKMKVRKQMLRAMPECENLENKNKQKDYARKAQILPCRNSFNFENSKMYRFPHSILCRLVIKNLVLGYFHTPSNKRNEVLHLIGKVLEFNHDEMEMVNKSQKLLWSFLVCLSCVIYSGIHSNKSIFL